MHPNCHTEIRIRFPRAAGNSQALSHSRHQKEYEMTSFDLEGRSDNYAHASSERFQIHRVEDFLVVGMRRVQRDGRVVPCHPIFRDERRHKGVGVLHEE